MKHYAFAVAAGIFGAATGGGWAESLDNIGIISGPLGNSFYVSLAAGAEAAAKEINPDAKVTVTSYENDLGKQFNLIDSLTASGAQLIALVAADPDAITPAIKKAVDAGVTVVGMDAAANGAQANVVTDNVQGGYIVCSYIAEQMGGEGKVALINGPQVQGVIDRIAGCNQALAENPGIKIVADEEGDASRDSGFSVMQRILTREGKVDGVFAINDPMAIGANLAAKQAGYSGITIGGFDGGAELVNELKSESMVAASAAQDPFSLGFQAVKLGAAIRDGSEAAGQLVKAPTGLVTRDTVDSYPGWREK
jgi:ribose transport system substrate-binding protein